MIKGLDCSHYDGFVDWDKVKEQGNMFCFLKATEGDTYTDSQFSRNWKGAPSRGLFTGAYHFFHPSQNPMSQANHFLKVVGPTFKGMLPPVLDWEVSDNMRVGIQVSRALAWLSAVESAMGIKPIIYLSPSFADSLGNPSSLSPYKLWLAHYGVNHPRIPRPWHDWVFWQYSEANGKDSNYYNGAISELEALAS